MKLPEKFQSVLAWFGAISLILGLVTGLWNLAERLRGPRLTAIGRTVDAAIQPDLRRELRNANGLLEIINLRLSVGTNASDILNEVRSRLAGTNELLRSLADFFEHNLAMENQYLEVTVENEGNEFAKNVALAVPARGIAEISSGKFISAEKNVVRWTNSIALGDIRPGASLTVRAWTGSHVFVWGIQDLKPALSYDKGTTAVRALQAFAGWDADLVAWFLGQSLGTRYTYGILLFALIVIFCRILIRRGHLVLRPRRPDVARQVAQPELID